MDDVEPADNEAYATHEDHEVDEVLERCPEIAGLSDWYDAAQRLASDLDGLDNEYIPLSGLVGLDEDSAAA